MKEILSILNLKEDASEADVLKALKAQIKRMEKLDSENVTLLSELDALKAAKKAALKGHDENAVAAKMAAGLTREQAVEVLTAQAAHDATKPHDAAPKEDK